MFTSQSKIGTPLGYLTDSQLAKVLELEPFYWHGETENWIMVIKYIKWVQVKDYKKIERTGNKTVAFDFLDQELGKLMATKKEITIRTIEDTKPITDELIDLAVKNAKLAISDYMFNHGTS